MVHIDITTEMLAAAAEAEKAWHAASQPGSLHAWVFREMLRVHNAGSSPPEATVSLPSAEDPPVDPDLPVIAPDA